MRTLVRAGIAGIALLLTGCAVPTRLMQMGPLSEREWLVTLVVSEDDRVVASECADVLAMGPIIGCHLWHRVNVPGVGDVRIVKIVRYTDALPSTLAQEIDVHELCHAIAALQPIDDPCHRDNDGIIQSAGAAVQRRLRTTSGESWRGGGGGSR